MAGWDVFHADRLELERGLDAQTIRRSLARGELRDDDLVRPAGTTIPWSRLAEVPELIAGPDPGPPASTAAGTHDAASIPSGRSDFEEIQPRIEELIPASTRRQPTELSGPMPSDDVTIPVLDEPIRSPASQGPPRVPSTPESGGWIWADEDDGDEAEEEGQPDELEDEEDLEILADSGAFGLPDANRPAAAYARPDQTGHWEPGENDLDLENRPESRSSHVALPVVRSRDREDVESVGEDADPDASFSLARPATTTVEELDLAPMVDVAFNLVLFFMVTASTILYKTLEIPKPSGEAPAGAVAQGRSRSMDDLKADYIIVEIDEQGSMKLDGEPVQATMPNLVELLRRTREKTGRKTMLLSANFATPHRNAVLAYDSANEIGLSIAIAKPQAPLGPAPILRPGPAAAAQPVPKSPS